MSDAQILMLAAAAAAAVVVVLFVALRVRRRRDRADLEADEGAALRVEAEVLPRRDEEVAREAAPLEDAPAKRVEAPVPKPLPKGRSYVEGLLQTREQGFVGRLTRLFTGRKLDAALLTEIEEVLLTADIGVRTAARLAEGLDQVAGRDGEPGAVWDLLRTRTEAILAAVALPPPDDPACGHAPHVLLVAGVNGSGKTTSIGKLAWRFARMGKRVHLVAGDTFRAAADDQLQIWAERAGATIFRSKDGADPAAVAFEGIRVGRDQGADVILVDTAGRLHTKANLVDELRKVHRVCAKVVEGAPHETYLVLDGTNGQNAIQQAITFREAVAVTGIVLTKLDGTAKGGVVIGIADELGLPIRYIGIGERPEDLKPFEASEFVAALFPAAR